MSNFKQTVIYDYQCIRIGFADQRSSGDFIDNLLNDLSFIVCRTNEFDETLIIQHSQIGHRIFHEVSFCDAIPSLISELNPNIDKLLLNGLLNSTYQNDADGIIDFNSELENKIFQTNDISAMRDFAPCYFGISSMTYDCDATINLENGNVFHKNEQLVDLSDLYGRIQDDEEWVIGFQL